MMYEILILPHFRKQMKHYAKKSIAISKTC